MSAAGGRSAFLTGGTGFVGLNLAETLTREGWQITALHREGADIRQLSSFGVRLAPGALEDYGSVLAGMPQGVDAVFHAGAKVSYWRATAAEQHQANVIGTRNMVRAALERGAGTFIHTSSLAAYGNLGGFVTEETVSDAASSPIPYLRTKYLAEQEVRAGIAQGLEAVILNPTNIVGRYDARNWARTFRMARQGKLPGVPPGLRSFCHGEEVARAHLNAVEKGRSGENYILSCTDATMAQVFGLIGSLLDCETPSNAIPGWLMRLVGTVNDARAFFTRREPDITRDLARLVSIRHICSSAKAQRELGYQPRSLESMFSDCHGWLQGAGLLG